MCYVHISSFVTLFIHDRSVFLTINSVMLIIMFCIVCTGVESTVDCTVQLKVASLVSRGQDALFALIDGGRSPSAPEVLRRALEGILLEEMESDQRELKEGYQQQDSLQYLVHTFLTAHRCVRCVPPPPLLPSPPTPPHPPPLLPMIYRHIPVAS